MDDLIAWLRVQLDEDEREARAALVLNEHWKSPYLARKWNEQLADVEAKRRILDLAQSAQRRFARWEGTEPTLAADVVERAMTRMEAATYEDAVAHLASAYASRPGYRDEWRPA